MTRQKIELRKKYIGINISGKVLNDVVKIHNQNMNFRIYKTMPNCITYIGMRQQGATNHYLYKA